MSIAPVLNSQRLTLRMHTADDLPDVHRLGSEPQVVEQIGIPPQDRETCWRRLLMYRGMWQTLEFGYLAITDRQTGRFLGEAGFADFKRDLKPCIDGLPEAGWALLPEAMGKGIATEAVQCMLHWLKKHTQTERIVCLISPDNKASINVAEKCGFHFFSDTVYRDEPSLLYAQTCHISP